MYYVKYRKKTRKKFTAAIIGVAAAAALCVTACAAPNSVNTEFEQSKINEDIGTSDVLPGSSTITEDNEPVLADAAKDENESVITEAEADKQENKNVVTDDIKGAFVDLYEHAAACFKSGDEEEFRTLFTESSGQDKIDYLYEGLRRDYLHSDYPDVSHIVFGNENLYEGFAFCTETLGNYPDAMVKQTVFACPFTNEDGEWKFVLTDESIKDLEYYYYSSVIPAAAKTAYENGMNFSAYPNHMWLDTDIVIPHTIQADYCMAWQNEDGSVNCLVNIKNGTDRPQSIKSLLVVLSDRNLGEIVRYFADVDVTVAAEKALNYEVIIPAEEVVSGTFGWTQLLGSCLVDVR